MESERSKKLGRHEECEVNTALKAYTEKSVLKELTLCTPDSLSKLFGGINVCK